MFTGIVEESGRVVEIDKQKDGARVVVEHTLDWADTKLGDSIAVDGCCLTVVALTVNEGLTRASFDLGPETLAVTTLGALASGARVHLERAVRLLDRLGGHLVQGHVDAVGTLETRVEKGEALLLRIAAPASVTKLCIHKGSIAVDGVSLTINHVDDAGFEVGLIPHTLEKTHLGTIKVGARVNLESDLVGKYIAKLVAPST